MGPVWLPLLNWLHVMDHGDDGSRIVVARSTNMIEKGYVYTETDVLPKYSPIRIMLAKE